MNLKNGVGLLYPAGIRGGDGYVFDLKVEIPAPGEAKPEEIRACMLKRFGPQWERGLGIMHSTDHNAALVKLWTRSSQHGVSTNGILDADGFGYTGVPTPTEIETSHRWMQPTPSPVLEAAHTILPFEYGYGRTPFDAASRQSGWPTETWKFAVQYGVLRSQPADIKKIILEQCKLIESGAVKGWSQDYRGLWKRNR